MVDKLSIRLLYKRLFGFYDSSRKLTYFGFAFVMTIVIPASLVSIAYFIACDGAQPDTDAHFCGSANTGAINTIIGVIRAVVDICM
jgi:hypothetical protein